MKPRKMKLNAHRSFDYYTPEDVEKIIAKIAEHIEKTSADTYGVTLIEHGEAANMVRQWRPRS